MTTQAQEGSIETFIRGLYPLFITLAIIVLIRLAISYLMSSLVEHGRITHVTKSAFMKLLDLILFFTAIVVALQTFFAPYQVFVALSVLVALIAITFFYELREFNAYINLQLTRRLRGRIFEIHLPNHNQPIYGKISSIDLFESTIEDIYGRKIHVPNSLLAKAVLREHVHSIVLRIALRSSVSKPLERLHEIVSAIKKMDFEVFRLDEVKVMVDEMSDDSVSLKVVVNPTVVPIRATDVAELINKVRSQLSEYNPVVRVVEAA